VNILKYNCTTTWHYNAFLT